MRVSYDVIVIGLGAMGSAALYQLAKRQANVVGIDQFDPPHTLGSTHGESRVTRLAAGEGDAYVPLVRRSHDIWRELEEKTGQSVLVESGGYVICPIGGGANWHGRRDFAQASAQIAKAHHIPHDLLSAEELRQRNPLVQIENQYHAYFEPTAGLVDPEAAVRAQLRLAKEMGAAVFANERVTVVLPDASGVTVITNKGRYRANKVIVATGPWIKQFAPKALNRSIRIYRQVMFWFQAEDWQYFSADRFPFLLWIGETEDDYFAAFPIVSERNAALKLMTEQYVAHCDPNSVSRTVTEDEIEAFATRFIPRKLRGVTQRCVAAQVCLYTVTPDEHFVIDWHPDSDRVLLVSSCSGHGFKHSGAIGEALSDTVLDGKSRLSLSAFTMKRLMA